ncbi:MAG: SIMPL domain-containing protein [Deltaproteobacteria bacterium]|nr:SIMPL domain-containing protein [Deltaproteobacteria bacterium]MCB9786673.1 SIMPL domain-containing protein [Deltaproteobacteria bacterium]
MSSESSIRTWSMLVVLPALALLGATWIASSTWERVRTRPAERTIEVTGSAKKRIVSDLIEWSAEIATREADRTEAYRALRRHVEAAMAWLTQQGVKPADVRVSSVTTRELMETEYVGVGEERIARTVSRGWSAEQTISIRSGEMDRIEKVSREITTLLEQGVPVTSYPPQYFYTKLGEVKVDMLAEAAADARGRAENIVRSGGGAGIDQMISADMGVINVNPANSTATSWDGNNDTTSLEKDIITIVHMSFTLK